MNRYKVVISNDVDNCFSDPGIPKLVLTMQELGEVTEIVDFCMQVDLEVAIRMETDGGEEDEKP